MERGGSRELDQGARAFRAGLAMLALVGLLGTAPSAFGSESCAGPLTGQSYAVPEDMIGFGRAQGLPALPLKPNEYVLTIDDGPRSDTTPDLLDILEDHCVKATFFLIGKRAEARPRLVHQILEGGHTLGTHTYSHPDLSKLSPEAIEAEMLKGRDVVRVAAEEGGDTPSLRLFRFPGSSGFPPVLPSSLVDMAKSEGLTVAGVDFSPQDWRNSPPEESFKRLFDSLGDRGVILFHDGMPNTLLLLPMVLDELERRGAKIVALKP